MTPTEYELLVQKLVDELASAFSDMAGNVIGSGARNRISGLSGYKHQIDVSMTAGEWLILVECKRWNTKIGVEEVLVLASRVADINPTVPGRQIWVSMVSCKGATRGAQALARHFHLNVDTVESPHEYAVRLRNHVAVGQRDNLGLGDSCKVEVIRAE